MTYLSAWGGAGGCRLNFSKKICEGSLSNDVNPNPIHRTLKALKRTLAAKKNSARPKRDQDIQMRIGLWDFLRSSIKRKLA